MAGGDDVPTIPGIDGLELVGRGGFAVVYRGRQPAYRRDVAVKVLLRSGLGADDRRRFDRECQAMGSLSEHPGIVTLYEAGFTGDERPYLVMAYVRDGTLGDSLAADGPLRWEDATALGVRLAGALETAHLAGVLHRDIKPANVLRGPYGAQLSDFGIARIAGAHETRSGVITASVAHAAPEILDGHPPTFPADVYGLASTLYEALTGAPAFVKETDEGLLPLIRRVIAEDPPDLRDRGVPDPVARVIEQAMAKDPTNRYQTAREFGLALRGAQAVLGIPVTDLLVVTPHDAAMPASTTDPTSGLTTDPDSDHPTDETVGHRTDPTPPPALTDHTADRATDHMTDHTTDRTTELGVAGGAAAVGATGETDAVGAIGAEQPPPNRDGRGEPDTDGSGGSRKALLITGVLLAVFALVVGLVALTSDGQQAEPEPTVAPTAVGGTSPDTSDPAPTTVESTETTAAIEAGTTPATTPDTVVGADRRVGLVSPAADPDHPVHAGVQRAAADLGLTVDVGDPGNTPDSAIFDQIAAGQNTIVALATEPTRQATVDAVVASADAHPEVDFIVIGAEIDAPNVASFTFPDHEGSFLVGAAAALASTTGRVGFLGGTDSEPIRAYEAGFVAGVRHVSPTTQVDVRYLPGEGEHFADTQLESDVATNLYEAGADVVFHAGSAGDGLFAAAAAAPDRWAIGVDVDQASTAAPDVRDAILTSMVKAYEAVAYDAVVAAAAGELPIGVNLLGVDRIDASTTGDGFETIPPILVDLRDQILGGQLVVRNSVEQRALAPLGTECPPEGCIVRIIGVEPSGSELLLTLEANWVLDIGGMHAHYFFSPRYAPEQVGADSPSRFGVSPGDWDLDDRYPQYVTEGAVSLAMLGEDTTAICVTAADVGHNVLDPTLFSCSGIPAAG